MYVSEQCIHIRNIGRILTQDAVHHMRPWTDFFRPPSLPLATNYVYRFMTNLLFYARNYLNVCVCYFLLVSAVYPSLFPCLLLAAFLHASVRATSAENWDLVVLTRRPLQVAQAVAVGHAVYQHGCVPFVAVFTFIALVIALHAMLTPYTDDGSRYLDDVTGKALDAPMTPIVSLTMRHRHREERVHRLLTPTTSSNPEGTAEGREKDKPNRSTSGGGAWRRSRASEMEAEESSPTRHLAYQGLCVKCGRGSVEAC